MTNDYDETADIMYITFGKPEPCLSTEVEGLLIRRNTEGVLNGITILDYSKITTDKDVEFKVVLDNGFKSDVYKLSEIVKRFDAFFEDKIWELVSIYEEALKDISKGNLQCPDGYIESLAKNALTKAKELNQ